MDKDLHDFLMIYNDLDYISRALKKLPKSKAEEILNKISNDDKDDLITGLKTLQKVVHTLYENMNN